MIKIISIEKLLIVILFTAMLQNKILKPSRIKGLIIREVKYTSILFVQRSCFKKRETNNEQDIHLLPFLDVITT